MKTIEPIAGAALLIALAAPAAAQDWPTRPLTMVVPFAAGASSDILGRILAPRLADNLGKPVIVENIGGAGGMNGANRVAKAAPDGYQFVVGSTGTLAINQTLYKNPPYNAATDFAPVALIADQPIVLIARNDMPVGNLAEFIAYARKEPGKVSFATSAAGSAPHLAAVLFQRMAGMQMVHVPYVGYPRAIQDTLAGFVDVIFANPQIIQSQTGKLRMLGVTTANRVADHSDIPAIAEALPGFAISGWVAVLAPKGTPPALVAKINADVAAILSTAEVTKRLRDLGVYPDLESLGTPQALMQFIRQDSALMESLIKAAGIKAEGEAPN
jgi:tripartite-type tricarboxylate transporter receptor subunit TctC